MPSSWVNGFFAILWTRATPLPLHLAGCLHSFHNRRGQLQSFFLSVQFMLFLWRTLIDISFLSFHCPLLWDWHKVDFCFVLFCLRGAVLGWTRGLRFARQVFYHLSQAPSPFWFGYFWDRVSHLCLGQPGLWSFHLHFLSSWNDECVPPCPVFYWFRWGLENFCPGGLGHQSSQVDS
jgi:hypothetical protein